MTRHLPIALCAVLATLLGSCSSATVANDVVALVRHGQYEEALELAQARAADRPNDPGAQRLLARARTAYLLDRGRTAVFEEANEEALALFQEASRLQPDDPIVASWVLKTRRELAQVWLARAQNYTSEELDAALAAYEKVLEYDPDEPQALLGLARVSLLMNYRAGRSLSYYRDGVEAFQNLLLEEAQRSFGISNELKENQEARRRHDEARKLLAEQRLAQARSFEQQGHFFPAKTEYHLALLLDPENEAAREGYNRMDREGRAIRKLDEAEMHRLRGDLEKAGEAVQEATVLSDAQKDAISLEESHIEEARYQKMYDRALSLEKDYEYEDAIKAYDELLAEAEFYKDAISRKDTVEWIVSEAAKFYGRALEAPDDAHALEHFRQADLVWPGYRDVKERIEALEARGVTGPTED